VIVLDKLKPTKARTIRGARRRLTILSNLERELSPTEKRELCSLRFCLRRELFSRIQLQKR
jgi:hypothetical protein